MEQLKENFKKSGVLHHAYIIEGEKENVVKQLVDFFEHDRGIPLANNPDYWHVEFEMFGVEEAHLLKERQARMSVAAEQTGARKLFVICAERFSSEAQNALLKTLEEPTQGTHLFFILPDASRVLPTVRSRVVFIRVASLKKINAFLASSYGEREKLIASIVEEKDRSGALALLSDMELGLKERFGKTGDTREYHAALSALAKCRSHLSGRAPSLKMLLEYLAVVVPSH